MKKTNDNLVLKMVALISVILIVNVMCVEYLSSYDFIVQIISIILVGGLCYITLKKYINYCLSKDTELVEEFNKCQESHIKTLSTLLDVQGIMDKYEEQRNKDTLELKNTILDKINTNQEEEKQHFNKLIELIVNSTKELQESCENVIDNKFMMVNDNVVNTGKVIGEFIKEYNKQITLSNTLIESTKKAVIEANENALNIANVKHENVLEKIDETRKIIVDKNETAVKNTNMKIDDLQKMVDTTKIFVELDKIQTSNNRNIEMLKDVNKSLRSKLDQNVTLYDEALNEVVEKITKAHDNIKANYSEYKEDTNNNIEQILKLKESMDLLIKKSNNKEMISLLEDINKDKNRLYDYLVTTKLGNINNVGKKDGNVERVVDGNFEMINHMKHGKKYKCELKEFGKLVYETLFDEKGLVKSSKNFDAKGRVNIETTYYENGEIKTRTEISSSGDKMISQYDMNGNKLD